jgi:hypothetical protein
MMALNEDIYAENVQHRHFRQSINLVNPVITKDMIAYYENFSKKYEI